MSEVDALKGFDWNKVTGDGLFVKFEAGKPLTLRVLTVDPVVNTNEFKDQVTGEITLTTKFNFVVYNFTLEKAQVLSATPNMAKKIGELHLDSDFGSDIRKIDIKITPTGEKLMRRYDIQVLPMAKDLTNDMIKECSAIKLDEKIKDGYRMSMYDPEKRNKNDLDLAPEEKEAIIETIEDEPINLDDIPF